MRFGIVDFRPAKTGADLFVVVEFTAAVGRDALMRQVFQQVDDSSGNAVGGLPFRFAAQEQATLSVDQSDKTGFSYRAAYGIGFPVAQPSSFIGGLGTLGKLEHERMPAATVAGRFLAPSFAAAAQPFDSAGDGRKIRADESAAINAAIDRGITDGDRLLLFFQTGGDLLGRPLFEVEELPYPLESLLVVKLSFAMTCLSASEVSALRYGRRIVL